MMKLIAYFGRILGLLIVFAMFGCSSNAPAQTANQVTSSSAGMDLDAAIREAAGQMEVRLPAKTTLALVSVASPSAAFSEQVITRLESAIVGSGKLGVVDRANLDKIRSEQGFQLSGEVDDDSAKAIGKLLGAGAIVTGSLTDLGDVYSLTLKAINIETAMVAVSYLADLAKTSRIETLLASGGGAGSGRTVTAQAAQTGNRSGGTTAQVYNIGDTGPAGGIVFYDMGFVMDGWRYLEAAPQNFPTKVSWKTGFALFSMWRTETGIGTGKRNTTIILSNLDGETMRAAQVVSVPVYGGYDDWFLPSIDELDLMYKNLKNQRIGDFSNDVYWSSSTSGDTAVWQLNFSDGSRKTVLSASWAASEGLVRAVRRF
jgi:hypothetical protein